jgi:NDP-sugar pyrophosphorylase family protein
VLTAGLGTRLRPLSLDRAKAAVPVAGQALVHRILGWLAAHGVGEATLNLHHRPETITRLVGDGSDVGVRVRYCWEPTILGSAGGPRLALDFMESDPFLIVNGDTLTDLELDRLVRAHVESDALVTLAVIPNPDPDWYGGVAVDPSGTVTGFPRAGHGPSDHFIGVQVAQKEAFAGLTRGDYGESVGQLYPRLIAERPGSIRAVRCQAAFRDVGTPADYLRTCLEVARSEGTPASLASQARIGAGAHVVDSVLWDEVVVEDRATLTRCVVGSGARIPADVTYRDSAIVRAGTYRPMSDERLEHGLLVAPLARRRAPAR